MKTNAIVIESTFVSIVLGVETSLGSVEIANIVAFADTAQAVSHSTAVLDLLLGWAQNLHEL